MAVRIDIDGVTLAVDDSGGGGPPLVLVHGLGGSAASWARLIESLRDERRVIAYDQRGAGESDKPVGPYSVEMWADDLVGVLDLLGVERCALLGHSVGCMVVEHAARALGERCLALAMLGGTLRWPEEALPGFEERARLARANQMGEIAQAVATTGLTRRAHSERPRLVVEMVAMLAANDPDAYAEAALATGRASMAEPGQISCPALAFCGAEDPVTPPAASEAVAAAMPCGESATVAGGAHWCQLEVPAAVAAPLGTFLRRVLPA